MQPDSKFEEAEKLALEKQLALRDDGLARKKAITIKVSKQC